MVLAKNRLREFRERTGLTQEKLADRVKVSRQTINSIEAGRYVPSLELALSLGQVFGCKVEDLFGIPEVADARKA
jgi:putative transcriptional regulator